MNILKKIEPTWIFGAYSVLIVLSVVAAILKDNFLILAFPLLMVMLLGVLVRFKYFYYLLFAMLPISIEMELPGGFGTDFPSELLMIFLTACGLFYFFGNPHKWNRHFFNHPLTLLVFLHLLWVGISAVFSGIFYISFKFFLAKSWYVLVFVFLTGLFIKKSKDFKPAFWCLLLPLIGVTLYTIARHYTYSFDFDMVNKTMVPFYRNHVNYAVMLVLWIPFMFFARKWYRFGSLARFVINIGIAVSLLGIFFAYTRAAYVSLLLIPIGYLLFHWKWAKPAIFTGLFTMVFAVSYLTIGNNYLNFAPDFNKTIYHANFEDHLSATFNFEDLSTMERFYRWIAGVNMSTEDVLTGFGPGNFYHYYKSYTTTLFETYVSDNEDKSTVHNYFLLILIEQGWPGFILFLTLCIYFFIRGEEIYHQTRDPQEKRFVMAILVSSLLIMANIFMADLIETDEIGSLFFINIALLVNQDLNNRRATTTEDADLIT